MPKANDYLKELGVPRAVDIVRQRLIGVVPDHNGCWLGPISGDQEYSTLKRYSNAQLKLKEQGIYVGRNAGLNFSLHRVSYLAHWGRDIDPGHTSSHICPPKNCFNPNHIISEYHGVNVDRTRCLRLFCPVHGTLILDTCTHSPKCIKDPIPGLRCCLDDLDEDAQLASSQYQENRDESQALTESYNERDPLDLPGAESLNFERRNHLDTDQEIGSEEEVDIEVERPTARSHISETPFYPSSPPLAGIPSFFRAPPPFDPAPPVGVPPALPSRLARTVTVTSLEPMLSSSSLDPSSSDPDPPWRPGLNRRRPLPHTGSSPNIERRPSRRRLVSPSPQPSDERIDENTSDTHMSSFIADDEEDSGGDDSDSDA